ncbi:MAG: electron transfer flavoprotein subunit beta [Chloroflexi bacterium HGW-Chloroflexi-10]|nr:MAG: electron transfer flavoprotein subunit beta [Chloroflexi bacterium HGW-Chloroflexi-10]
MKIIVPIKQVPETSQVKMDPETGTMIRKGLAAIINPLDLYAIESALQIKAGQDEVQVIVISMGPPKAEKALREALGMGCDEAVLLSDRRFGGADTWATAYTLTQAIHKLGGADLIICGERATDGDTGQVGPGIAALLDVPVATYVSKIAAVNSMNIILNRMVEGGYETLRMPFPSVLTVVKEVASPRLPTLRGMQRARLAVIPVWGQTDIDVDADKIGLKGSPTRVVKISTPTVARQGERYVIKDANDIRMVADRFVQFLQEKHVV